jgi:hypothetical protein
MVLHFSLYTVRKKALLSNGVYILYFHIHSLLVSVAITVFPSVP